MLSLVSFHLFKIWLVHILFWTTISNLFRNLVNYIEDFPNPFTFTWSRGTGFLCRAHHWCLLPAGFHNTYSALDLTESSVFKVPEYPCSFYYGFLLKCFHSFLHILGELLCPFWSISVSTFSEFTNSQHSSVTHLHSAQQGLSEPHNRIFHSHSTQPTQWQEILCPYAFKSVPIVLGLWL